MNLRLAGVCLLVLASVLGGCRSATHTTGTTHSSLPPSTAITSPVPTTAGAADCAVEEPGAISTAGAFVGLPHNLTVKAICVADVGPGLAGPEVPAEFSDMAAREVTRPDITIGTGPKGVIVLKALVGKVSSGNADAFVDAFLSRVGETRNEQLKLGGHVVRYFNIPGGEGYAYAEGPTVAIGFITQASELGIQDLALTQESAKDVFTRIVAAIAGRPIAADARTENGIESLPLGRGNYTTADDPGWVFFTTDAEQECGIGPNGTLAGCDNVPSDAPSGTNQVVVDTDGPARYAYSDVPTFTRDVDVLLPGHRLENGNATCSVGYQGTVGCQIGEHSFVVSSTYGVLE